MTTNPHYIIRGGVQGRERLRLMSRVLRSTTLALLQRAGIRAGMICLDVGCGGGDVAFDMAKMVAPSGSVIGTDIDETKLELARAEASELGLGNIEFHHGDISQQAPGGQYDLVHARFVLTHLPDPAGALTKMWNSLRPDGILIIEDIDFQGYFCHPHNPAMLRYVEFYTRTAERRGADANIGPRLPSLVRAAGFENVEMNIVQLASEAGELKLITPLTMENITDAVVAEGLASAEEVERLVVELYEYANNPGTIGCTPRIFEVWGNRPAS